MKDKSLIQNLIGIFTEKMLCLDIITNYKDTNFYSNLIVDIAEILNIACITLDYNSNFSNSTVLAYAQPLYSNDVNVLYSNGCNYDITKKVSYTYTQSDGCYILNFFPVVNSECLNDEDLTYIKKISDISFNVLGRIKLLEISKINEYYDYLTGTLNTNGIMTILNRLISKNTIDNYFCAYINIKKFKQFNDKYSYIGGDKILKVFSKTIYNYLGEKQYFGRLGGDNFVILALKDNKQDFLSHMQSISMEYENDILTVELYMGIYNILKNDDISTIISNASTSFNIAKTMPNSKYVEFNDDIYRHNLEVREIESVMHSALENGEFITFYQPKINLNSFQLVGAEALVRWKRKGELIPPYKFVPIFEKNGFITEIDFRMLKNVCISIKDWISRGIEPVTISVNFSKLHLSDAKFVPHIKEVIQSYGISPKYIEVEFTETLDVENYNSLVQVNRELKKYGFKTSIDDFGAGFSSLNMLKDVPVDVVKLDKSLIDDTASSTREKIILQDIVKMAKTLDIEVIAEGVEDLDQLLFLKNIRCNQIQGYIFDKPLPLNNFQDRLNNKEHYKSNPKFKSFIQNKYSKDDIKPSNFGKYIVNINDYSLVKFNDGFCDIVGYSREEILKNNYTIENFILRDEFNQYSQEVISTLKTTGEICNEHKMIKKNGTKIYVMCLGTLKDNNTAEFMISDISTNKVAERENDVLKSQFDFLQHELKNKNYIFEQIMKNILGGIGIFYIKDDSSLIAMFLSNSFYNTINISRVDFKKRHNDISEIFAPQDKVALINDINKCISENCTIVKRYKLKNSLNNNREYLTLRIKSLGTKSTNGYPMLDMVVADFDFNNVEKELIDGIAKISLLTECSNFEVIPLSKEELCI